MKMKIAVTGKSTGRIRQRLIALGAEPLSCDITIPEQVLSEIKRVKPDVIVHAAALTSVDECHRDYEKAILTNVRGTNHVCEMASEVLGDGHVVLLSTDHVFNGQVGKYKESDEPLPLNEGNYGLTKFAAEGIMQLYGGKIIRMSKGISKNDRDIEAIARGEMTSVPSFIVRSYCHLDFLAVAIWNYANRFEEMPELLHIAGTEAISFYELARMINSSVRPRHEELRGYSPRSLRCGLDVSLAASLGIPLFSPEQSVERLRHED